MSRSVTDWPFLREGSRLGSELVRGLSDWLLGQERISRIVAVVDLDNRPSRGALESAGFAIDHVDEPRGDVHVGPRLGHVLTEAGAIGENGASRVMCRSGGADLRRSHSVGPRPDEDQAVVAAQPLTPLRELNTPGSDANHPHG